VTTTVVGIDVGGTFTDIILLDERSGEVRTIKVPSTRTREAGGFLAGLSAVTQPAAVSAVVHGTTVATNALLERKGAPCGLIATAGFGDVLEMRRRDRPATWGLRGDFRPVIPHRLRIEVAERMGADGAAVTQIDPDEVSAAAETLLARGAQAVVIAFLNSYANPANELAAEAVVRDAWPNEFVTRSTTMLAEIREFERTSTAALNGYLQPVVSRYLADLDHGLTDAGFDGEFLVVQSNGGVATAAEARHFPVRTALSGPAAGVIAATRTAAEAGIENIITCDMGGTSFDVALVAAGRPTFSQQASIGFGLVVRTPMIEITTIGAGGGSIAAVDAAGILKVGPESAGSDPGPASYGLGNERPTVTDANLVLGRIDPDHPLGTGLERLDVDAARGAIERHVAQPLALTVEQAAEAVIDVTNARLAGAIRLISVERGQDPASFCLICFGGGGALHVGAMLRAIRCPRALIPRMPGLTSALGCVLADLRHDFVHTLNVPLQSLDPAILGDEMRRIARAGRRLLEQAGVAIEGVDVQFELDMAYEGQSHAVGVGLQALADDAAPTREDVARAFDGAYRTAYGRTLDEIPVNVLTLRAAVIGRRPPIDLSVFGPADTHSVEEALVASRPTWTDSAWRQTPVYERFRLPAGAVLEGPCLLRQPDTTILIEPGMRARTDKLGNVLVEVSAS
jgi:N-methylhydantoinase A